MEFWGVEVKAGETLPVLVEDGHLIHVSQVALGDVKNPKSASYVPVRMKVEDKKFVIETLSADKGPQISFDLVLDKDFELSHDWKDGSIYFCGYTAEQFRVFGNVLLQEYPSCNFKLTQGITDSRLGPNEILKEIAKAVGVPVDPSEISRELESFRKEKEEAEIRKERAEVFFFEQVIALLSQADAARDYDEVRKQYFQRLQLAYALVLHVREKPLKLGLTKEKVVIHKLDVWTVLGRPCAIHKKEVDQMGIHCTSDHQLRTTLSGDYFYNYFTRGFDILFDGKTHTIKKFILHSNYPGHTDFNSYSKCNFIICNPDYDGSFQHEVVASKCSITPSFLKPLKLGLTKEKVVIHKLVSFLMIAHIGLTFSLDSLYKNGKSLIEPNPISQIHLIRDPVVDTTYRDLWSATAKWATKTTRVSYQMKDLDHVLFEVAAFIEDKM